MISLSSFCLSDKTVSNPNIYPYNVFNGKYIEPFVFAPITVLYGNNGSGKSTVLNIMANRLGLRGMEKPTSNTYGIVDYCDRFTAECFYRLGEDEDGRSIQRLPENSRYIKSEDILYEIKKIQQQNVLSTGMEYDCIQLGMSRDDARRFVRSTEGHEQESYIMYSQEKYSNGETALQYFEKHLQPNGLYLLDEPEISLSPQKQVALAEEINTMARLLQCQFIIATHSPFMLGTLHAKIYNLDGKEYDTVAWTELEHVRYFYDFFKKHEEKFQ